LVEAVSFLAAARLAVKTVPFKYIAKYLGTHMAESAHLVNDLVDSRARQVGWAVRTIARRTPWKSNCLAQAIAAKRMLDHRRIPSTLYLGVQKDELDVLSAHAWLRCGEQILTGGSSSGITHTIVSKFA
jgi:hypothetical protein